MVGPIDLDHQKITLKATLEKQAPPPLDSFLQTCQNQRQDFEQTSIEIIKANMTFLHKLKYSLDNLFRRTNFDFGLLNEVSLWIDDLTTLREIKSQKYQMLTSV